MRIVIDLQSAQSGSRLRGIGRYTLSIAKALIQQSHQHEILLILNACIPDTIEPIRTYFADILPQANLRVWHTPSPINYCDTKNNSRRAIAQLLYEAFLLNLSPDIVYIPSFFEGYEDELVISIENLPLSIPIVVTLHDLIPLLNPELYLTPNPVYQKYYLEKIERIKRATALLAVSESSAREGREILGFATSNIINTSEGCDNDLFKVLSITAKQAQYFRQRFQLAKSFILYCSAIDPRKNHERLITAYAQLPKLLQQNYQLVFIGNISAAQQAQFIHQAKTLQLPEDALVSIVGSVTDADMVMFYNLCHLFVFPSWHEGFGLPILEAMACGAPVIGANTSSIPEIIGRQDALFNPFDENDITKKITQLLTDENLRLDLKHHGLNHVKTFSWKRSANIAMAFFETLHAKRLVAQKIHEQTHHPLQNITQVLLNQWLTNKKHHVDFIDEADFISLAQAIAKNQFECFELPTPDISPLSQQLFIDISELVQRDAKTGIQRVTRSLLKHYLEHPPQGYRIEPVYATAEKTGYYYAYNFTQHFLATLADTQNNHLKNNFTNKNAFNTAVDYRNPQTDMPIAIKAGDIFFGLDFQTHVVTAQRKYLHTLRQQGLHIYFLLHDLLPISLPHYFEPSAATTHANWLQTLSEFDGVVCVSRTVADELHQWLQQYGSQRLRPLKLGWSHSGADMVSSLPTHGLPNNAIDVLQKLKQYPSFLMVGTLEPRKGHQQVLAAFELLWQKQISVNLVIVGKQGWMVDALVQQLHLHPQLHKHLFWLESISDEYLNKIYQTTTCLIAASAGEGFGLPLIEAAQYKLPLLVRDIPIFREVAAQHASYFSGTQGIDLSTAIEKWLTAYKKNKHCKSDQLPWLTWEKSAQNLLNILLQGYWYQTWKPT